MRKIYVWIRPDKTYYFKFIKGHYKYKNIGDVNQYNHSLVLIIDNPYIKTSGISPRKSLKRFIRCIYNKI